MVATTSTWRCENEDVDTGLRTRGRRHEVANSRTSTRGCGNDDDIGAAATTTTSTRGCGSNGGIDTRLRQRRCRHRHKTTHFVKLCRHILIYITVYFELVHNDMYESIG